MVKLSGMLSRFVPVKVLVIGDFMRDVYTKGKIHRISPEAPVSVLHVQNEESRPGGAGNVCLNLVSLGAAVIAVGRIGSDLAGNELKEALEKEHVDTAHLFCQKDYKTPVKNRLIADAQQILRVDFETVTDIPESLEQYVIACLPPLIEQVQIVAVSDYGKGFLSRTLLKEIISISRSKGIPVIVDPKGEDFIKYSGASVIKPNLQEVYAAAKLTRDVPLEKVADIILATADVDMLLVTRSEAGMSLFHKNGQFFDFPVRSKEVKDVTGAGDTVLAMISLALANNLDIKYGAQLANIAAGMAIERLGCARILLSEMAERLLQYDVENKIFDEEHLFALQQVLQGKRYNVLGIDSTAGMSTGLFRSLRKLSPSDSEKKLIVYIRDTDPDEEFVLLLSSLSEVDFIVLKCESLKNLCEIIHPNQVFVMQEDRLVTLDHATALIGRLRDTISI
ncbi:MAG TPA: PfkB family carbohydrate kinase [Rhabdochlamydiaceae bacterium]|jgi:D-beta-D-heptose 7-phosphate kinase/D-beta-D-heptose 1-phosphate adenosyltransferase